MTWLICIELLNLLGGCFGDQIQDLLTTAHFPLVYRLLIHGMQCLLGFGLLDNGEMKVLDFVLLAIEQ
uniref:Uncharacterized protein n=1 Tax=Caenorhabditis japonica TaxID=281687 RepID=A0A8R1EBJ6_CAEJA